MIIIVTYDLKTARDYTPLYEALKQQGNWWHYLANTWILYTSKTPDQVYNAICSHIGKADRAFVGTLANGYEGWLPKEAWDWLKNNGLPSR